MKNQHFARKKRQLKNLSRQLEQALQQGTNNTSIETLKAKVKHLVNQLRGVLARTEIVRLAGAAALVLGLASSVETQAQTFDAAVKSPFGLGIKDSLALPTMVDIDGDGDFDMFLGEYYGALTYFENTGTSLAPAFAAAQRNPFGLQVPASANLVIAVPTFADFDNDGDQDCMIGGAAYYSYSGDFYYFENTGSATAPAFAAPQTNPFGLSATAIFNVPKAVDLDSDGDFDLFCAEYDGTPLYFENTGTASAPAFAAPQITPFGLSSSIYFIQSDFADFDSDGDLDIIVGDTIGNILYFPNTGSASIPSFGSPQTNPFGLTPTYYQAFPAVADMDADGDVDIFVSDYGNEMIYFQNREFTIGEAEMALVESEVFPNPADDVIGVMSEGLFDTYRISDITGKKVLAGTLDNQKVVVKQLPAGKYFITLQGDGQKSTRSFVKR